MKKTNRRIALAVVLTLCITLLAGTITARANIDGDIGVCWWKMNRAHDGAEAARALGCTDEYVLKWFGDRWTEANNERKRCEICSLQSGEGELMTIYKCDRCGTIIESEYDVFVCQIDDPEKEPDKTGRVYARAKKFDLCKDCARAVMEVIES